jgi:pyridoxine 5-phosphate synthase
MTALSVNINKIALLRNSRGHNFPSVSGFAQQFLELGAAGITVHPRPDERHVCYSDVPVLSHLLQAWPQAEFNVEGYPTNKFLNLVLDNQVDQCTLVPDAESQLTSDHGWDCSEHAVFLKPIINSLQAAGVRVSLFIDPDPFQAEQAAMLGADRVELYTEAYAKAFGTNDQHQVLDQYALTIAAAKSSGLAVNAGHDLNLHNLADFLALGDVLEVSIGHALIVECLQFGIVDVMSRYRRICDSCLEE